MGRENEQIFKTPSENIIEQIADEVSNLTKENNETVEKAKKADLKRVLENGGTQETI